MKKDNIKICLSGNGSDELFVATTITIIYIIIRLKIKPLKKFFNRLERKILPIIRNKEYRNIDNKKIKTYFTLLKDEYLNKKIKPFNEKIFTKNLLRNKMLNELLYQTVPLALTDDDLNSMHYSIENRSPFLNKDLINTSLKLPSQIFMKNAYNKYLLRLSSKK